MAKSRAGKKTKASKSFNVISPFRSVFVTIICLLGMGAGLWLFREDMNASVREMGKQPIGSVFFVRRAVQRLSAYQVQWDRLERHSPLYDGDIVSTAAFSDVKISFANGEILELSENTTVRITRRDSEGALLFECWKGEIQVQSGRFAVEVAMAEGRDVPPVLGVELKPRSGASMNIHDGVSCKLFQGTADLSTKEGHRGFTAGNAVRVGSDGTLLPNPPGMMLSPRNGARVLRDSRRTALIQFTWKVFNPALTGGVWLELSKTRDFLQPVGKWFEQQAESMGIPLTEGTYYWRMYTAQSMLMDSGQFEIVYAPPPRAISPANRSTETVLRGKPELRFTWSVPEEAEAVLLEVASNAEMNRPRLRQLIRRTDNGNGSFVTAEIGPGEWYWRIHPVYPGGVAEEDSQSYWRVRSMTSGLIADDQPSAVNSFILVEAAELPAQRTWDAVKAADREGIPRLIFPRDNYTHEASRSPDLLFAWKNPHSHSVRFQIAERSDFSSGLIIDDEVFGYSVHSPYLKPGIYYWRVVSAGSDDSASFPSRLVIMPSLAAPRLQSPRDNESLRIVQGVGINFSWEPMSYADYYSFHIYPAGRNYPLNDITALQNNSVQVYFDPGTAGSFRWTVQGFTAATENTTGRSGLIAESHFIIPSPSGAIPGGQTSWNIPRIANIQTYSGEVQSPITLVSPTTGLTIPGIQALRSPPTARWTSAEPLRNAQLIVSHTADPASDPRAIVLGASAGTAVFPPLGEGIWYWIIRGDTADIRGATPGHPFWINVLPTPLLSVPRITQPTDHAAIDLIQLTRDRSITFRWDSVEGANAYIFSLYYAGSPPTLLVTGSPDSALSYVLHNLSLLQEGNHLWQVEAVYRNSRGIIEQRGRIVQHPFAIEVQRSGSPTEP